MKRRYFIHVLLTAVALSASVSCTKDGLTDGGRLPEGQYPLVIDGITLGVEGGEAQPWGAPQTRISENKDGMGSVFDKGDSFAVQMDGNPQLGIYTIQDDASVTAETPLYWSDQNTRNVNAWYPATDGTIDLGDQSQRLVYLLNGTGTGDYRTYVTLNFTHALAKVRVTPSDEALGKVQRLQLYTCTQCTYEKGRVGQGSQDGWIEMKKCEYIENGVSVTCWEANVVPGYEITRLLANGSEERNLSKGIIPVAGKLNNITLNYDKGYNLSSDGRTYEVYSARGLLAWNEAAQKDRSLNCILTRDIDMTGKEWVLIGDRSNYRYNGTFDGGNHTITGLTVNQPETDCVGLIGYLGGGTVKNLTLENVNITGRNYVGGVVGYNYNSAVTNCTVTGDVSGSDYVGGVVGFNVYRNSVTNCTVAGDIFGNDNVGGVVGINYFFCTVTDCTSSGYVNGNDRVGGVVGDNRDGSTVIACTATGNVNGNDQVGGVAGQSMYVNNDVPAITACIATGDVTGGDKVGGVVGDFKGNMTACYHATGNVSGSTDVGGVAGYNSVKGIVTACYWSNTQNTGIGTNNGTSETMKVTDGNWAGAVEQMNTALQGVSAECRYEIGDDGLPVLRKQ